MTNWKSIEIGGNKSGKNTEDSLNDEDLNLQDDDYQDDESLNDDNNEDQDIDMSDDSDVDLAQEDVLEDEDTDDSDSVNSLDDDKEEKASKKVKKEQKLSRSQERIMELNARTKAAEEEARRVRAELEEMRKASVADRKQSLESDIAAVKLALAGVEKDLKAAIEAGDSEALIKNQKLLSEYTVKGMALESQKATFEVESKKAPEKREETQQKSATPPFEARQWLERNKSWFNKNEDLTRMALLINQELLAKMDDTSPEYYSELDRRMKPFLPSSSKEKSKEDVKKQKSTPVVGASSKASPPVKVKAGEKERAIARRLGVDPEEYLKQMVAYEKNKQAETQTYKPISISKKDRK